VAHIVSLSYLSPAAEALAVLVDALLESRVILRSAAPMASGVSSTSRADDDFDERKDA
jgi:hypothetical protein